MTAMSDSQDGDLIHDLQAAIKTLRKHNDTLVSAMEYIKARSKNAAAKTAIDKNIALDDIFKSSDMALESVKKDKIKG